MSVVGPWTGAGQEEGTKYSSQAPVAVEPLRAKPAPPRPVTNAISQHLYVVLEYSSTCVLVSLTVK